MNMILLGDLQFGNEEAITIFLGEHEICHQGINQAVIDQYGYPIFDLPMGEIGNDSDWLLNHYKIHQSLSATLGLTGLPDLSDVDFSDETEFYDWIQSHNLEHQKINAALGLL